MAVRLIALFLLFFFIPTRPSLAAPKQVINIGNGVEPKDLDPHIVTGVAEGRILTNLFEPLARINRCFRCQQFGHKAVICSRESECCK